MTTFNRFQETTFYPSDEQTPGSGYLAYYLLDESEAPDSISYSDSWSDYQGVYLFLKSAPAPAKLTAFIRALGERFPVNSLKHTSLAWLVFDETKEEIDEIKLLKVGLHEDEKKTTILDQRFDLEILKASFLLEHESQVTVRTNERGELDGLIVEYPMSIKDAPPPVPSKNVLIPLSGQQRGCLSAEIALNEAETAGIPNRGFYFFITKPGKPDEYLRQYYPLFSKGGDHASKEIHAGYQMTFDPLAPYDGNRTRITYLGFAYSIIKISDPPYLQLELVTGSDLARPSGYASVFGKPVKIAPIAGGAHPGGYILCQLPPDSPEPYYMAPFGDFEVTSDSGAEIAFACGLSGTEFFSIKPDAGDAVKTFLRFKSDQPAVVKEFPFELASPVGPPLDPVASPFSAEYRTSWATVIAPPGQSIPYISQPKGAALYGKTQAPPSENGILEHVTTPFQFCSDEKDFFPMVPYAGLEEDKTGGAMSNDDMQALEEIVLSKQRRSTISRQVPSGHVLRLNASDDDVKHYATTPAGLLVTTMQNESGSMVSWNQFLLATNGNYELAFNNPPDEVVNAMQSSNVFLVASNATHLGDFSNAMGIEGWELKVNVGSSQRYDDYRNIMIFKGRKGKLYDPNDVANCLVANPKKWNQTEDFSIPKTESNEDPAQLIILSNWLQEYFKNAHQQENDYFTKFNAIATDENWTGILFLRVDINDLPSNIRGMVAGVTDQSAFNAHHLGVEISPIRFNDGVPDLSTPSSLFGLIYYNDPAYDPTKPDQPVPPNPGQDYDFRVLDLKVLFENSAVKHFESYAQLTLNRLFGSVVSKMGEGGNLYNSIILKGALQHNGNTSVYSLGTVKDYVFSMDNNVFNKIEIASASMNTLSSTADKMDIWFGLTGYLDFKTLQKVTGTEADPEILDIDLFSFGSTDGKTLREGLYFSNMGIAETVTGDQKTFAFATQNIRFDIQASTTRLGSLYPSFALGIEALTGGDAENTPAKAGYLNIITDLRLSGVDGGDWTGLKFQLNLGTPGELAGKVGLNADLLLAWANQGGKDDDFKVNVGLHLPGTTGGASLISLQNVLTLSFGPIRLIYAKESATSQERRFMLMLTSIALKFLGLMKIPPNGNTLFYLFGNPQSAGEASGLGWYAKYGKEDEKNAETVADDLQGGLNAG